MQITGNGRAFIDAMDLTDELRAEILDVFEAEVKRSDRVRHDRRGRPAPIDCLSAATRCITFVRRAAQAAGWDPDAAERLATVAGRLYAGVLVPEARRGGGSR